MVEEVLEENVGVLQNIRNSKIIKFYSTCLAESGIKIPVFAWFAIAFAAAAIASVSSFFFLGMFGFNEIIIPIVIFIVLIDGIIGIPYLKGTSRIEEIERNFPDALKQMADTLKAGSTYESALREVASPDLGALGEEMQNVLRKLEEGENFENALLSLSENVDSRFVKRVVTIIIDTVRAGAGLAEILEDIAEDAREMYRVHQDRRTRTMMQVMFIVTAGAVLTPFIFGVISQVISFLITVAANSGTVADSLVVANAFAAKDLISLLLEVYLVFEVLASSAMMALMREGKISKSIIYFPVLLFLAIVIFFISRFAIGAMLAGLGGI